MRTTSDGRLAGVGHASRFTTQLSSFTLLAGVAAVTLPIHEAYAQAVRVTACDILTAHPDDRQRVSDPVSITERDAARALPACEEALRTDPNNARLRYQLGLALDTARRFTESFAAYQQAAQAGYVAAGHALAWAYANAEGTERNDAEAVRWYRWAAERGHTGSMNTLGFMLENGRGAPRDLIQAADWYRRAYDTDGRPIAAFNWARLLSGGRGVPQDNARAVQLFRVAAQAGRADAGLQLALMAERGEAPQVTQAELIQLLAIAEAGSAQRDRARRSLDRMNTEGLSGDIHLARGAASDMQASQDLERRAARQRREQALARVTQPAVASAPATPLTPAAPAQPAAAAAAPAVPASPSVSAQPAWLTTLWSNPVALAGAAGAIAVLLAGLGFWLGNRRGRQAAGSVRQEPYVAPMPLVAAGAERSATMAPPAVAVSPPAAVPSSMDTSTKVVAGATQSAPVVRDANQTDTLSIIQHDKQLPAQDPEQAHKAWLAEAEARRVKAAQAWESRDRDAQQGSERRQLILQSPRAVLGNSERETAASVKARRANAALNEAPFSAGETRSKRVSMNKIALGVAGLAILFFVGYVASRKGQSQFVGGSAILAQGPSWRADGIYVMEVDEDPEADWVAAARDRILNRTTVPRNRVLQKLVHENTVYTPAAVVSGRPLGVEIPGYNGYWIPIAPLKPGEYRLGQVRVTSRLANSGSEYCVDTITTDIENVEERNADRFFVLSSRLCINQNSKRLTDEGSITNFIRESAIQSSRAFQSNGVYCAGRISETHPHLVSRHPALGEFCLNGVAGRPASNSRWIGVRR